LLAYKEKTISGDEEENTLDNTKAYKLHVIEMEDLFIKIINKFKITEQNKSQN
jgi:hypothetical protein